MDNLHYKVKLYLEDNGKTESEFDSNIVLQDDKDGNGAYIKKWDVCVIMYMMIFTLCRFI